MVAVQEQQHFIPASDARRAARRLAPVILCFLPVSSCHSSSSGRYNSCGVVDNGGSGFVPDVHEVRLGVGRSGSLHRGAHHGSHAQILYIDCTHRSLHSVHTSAPPGRSDAGTVRYRSRPYSCVRATGSLIAWSVNCTGPTDPRDRRWPRCAAAMPLCTAAVLVFSAAVLLCAAAMLVYAAAVLVCAADMLLCAANLIECICLCFASAYALHLPILCICLCFASACALHLPVLFVATLIK